MLKKYEENKELLCNDLINGKHTLIEKPRFKSIDLIKKEIYDNDIQGDIIECGVWKGGMAIYLAYQFPDRIIWASDSYKGFQPLNIATYEYKNERHTENFDAKYNHPFSISVSLDDVKANFKEFDVVGNNIKFLEGWVKDTLDPKITEVKEIAVLRIDVDAYSATLEVLDFLYDKVAVGGYIIFDDSALVECRDAIREFKRKRNITFELTSPSGKVGNDLSENGGYFKKLKND